MRRDRVMDVLMAFPGLLLAIALVAVLGPSVGNVILALSLIGWVGYARLVRGQVLRTRSSSSCRRRGRWGRAPRGFSWRT
jgi:ABC-type dipeptide/oligopeptide/nickel transport system permease subunit